MKLVRVAPDDRHRGRHWRVRVLLVIVALGVVGGIVSARRTPARAASATPLAHQARLGGNPFAGRAMWVWEMSTISGGDPTALVSGAKAYGLRTVLVKSSDGTGFWTSQFTPQLVSYLHANGLRVCAWQYVYGDHPVTEAYMGADAVRMGADCLVIDAESQYEGKYVAAQTYMKRLRTLIGASFPVALAGFPYIDYHPAFPYSVFLGPGGAQYNVPQMYWRDIGTTVDAVFAHTYSYNLIYQRAIYPLGQVFQNPPARQIVRFRQLSRIYGARGISWWDWQESSKRSWIAVSRPAGGLAGYTPYETMASIGQGATGDMVVWAQEHLVSAGDPIMISGDFGYHTLLEVEAFQSAHGLLPDGIVGPATWSALLRYPAANVIWTKTGAVTGNGQTTTTTTTTPSGGTGTGTPPGIGATSAAAGGRAPFYERVPRSASERARRDEIPSGFGAGRP